MNNTYKFTCNLCMESREDEDSLMRHFISQHHKKKVGYCLRHNDIYGPKLPKCVLLIGNMTNDLPNSVRYQIIDYFSLYGKVAKNKINNGYGYLQFETREMAEKLVEDMPLPKSVAINGITIYVENVNKKWEDERKEEERYKRKRHRSPTPPAQSRRTRTPSPKDEPTPCVFSLEQLKSFKGTFEQEMELLLTMLQPNFTSFQMTFNRIGKDMCDTLKPAFRDCFVYPFGSCVTGLVFNNSDLDMYVQTNDHQSETESLKKMKRVLQRSRMFTRIIPIFHAKIPIIKCIHVPTSISCDINCRNMLGVCNSKLISYFMRINERKLRPLTCVIKNWGKIHELTGKSHLFTSYSLCLMFIFYLQQTFEVPNVYELQQNPAFHDFQQTWNGGFEPVTVFCSKLKDATALSILQGFFNYYANFNYPELIICPFLGRPVERKLFSDVNTIPAEFVIYKNTFDFIDGLSIDKDVCLQDPFEHTRNTSANVSQKIVTIFKSYCEKGEEVCKSGASNILHKLYTWKPPDLAGFNKFEVIVQKVDTFSLDDSENNEWFDTFRKFLEIFLRDILKFTLNEVSLTKQPKISVDQIDSNTKFKLKSWCYFDSWNNRKGAQKGLTQALPENNVEKQIMISDSLMNIYDDLANSDTKYLEFEIFCQLVGQSPPRAKIVFTKKSEVKSSFKTFSTFFNSNFRRWFSIYQQDVHDEKKNLF